MKNLKRNFLAVLLGASVVFGGVMTSTTLAYHETKDLSLEDHMEIMGTAMKKLRSSLKKDSKNAASLQWLEKMQLATVTSKAMTPHIGKDMPPEALEKMKKGYRIKMNEQLILLAQMEIAVLKGQNKVAYDKMYKKDLKDMKKDGHAEFIKDE